MSSICQIWTSLWLRNHLLEFMSMFGKFKIKYFWTKIKLSKIYPHVDPMCDRCYQAHATTAHMFWSWPSLHYYWSHIFKTLSEVLGIRVEPLAVTALFGALSISLDMPKYKKDFVAFVTLLARCQILIHWKSASPPTHSSCCLNIICII